MHKEQKNDTLLLQLNAAILELYDQDECSAFLADLCTINELKAMAQRLEVARLIGVGHTYDEIEQKTGASTATISRIKRFLYNGNGGYQVVLDRLSQTNIDKS